MGNYSCNRNCYGNCLYCFNFTGKWGIDGNDSSDYIEIKEENIQQDISVIHLNWVSGDVQVKKSSNNQIRIVQRVVKIIHRSNYSQLKIDGDTLYIEDTRGYGINMFGFQNKKIQIWYYIYRKKNINS